MKIQKANNTLSILISIGTVFMALIVCIAFVINLNLNAQEAVDSTKVNKEQIKLIDKVSNENKNEIEKTQLELKSVSKIVKNELENQKKDIEDANKKLDKIIELMLERNED